MNKELLKKINQSVRLLKSYEKFLLNRGYGEKLEIAYSGGKDSDVLLWLAHESNIECNIVHKCTTIDPPGTIKHCLQNHAIILQPQQTFLQLVEKKGWPTMSKRFCCQYLKEYFNSPYVVDGVRANESVKRQKRYTSPSNCRMYSKEKIVEIIHPIYKYTNEDICNIIKEQKINLHPLYYDQNGIFHVERRLGCIGCPLQGDRGRKDFQQYPKLFRAKVKAFLRYAKTRNFQRNQFDYIMYEVFYSNHGEKKYQQTWKGLFVTQSPKQFMEDYFKIELPKIEDV